jgi:hypothetical protein
MEIFVQILILLADALSGLVNVCLTSVADLVNFFMDSDLPVIIFAAAVVTYSDIPAEALAAARRWHGTIDEQFSNIDNLVTTIQGHPSWGTPSVFSQIVANRTQLIALISKCRSTQGSTSDRGLRNILLKMTVGLCLAQVKAWVFTQYYNNIISLNDVHMLGFLLPGETGGHHGLSVATDVVAEVKINIISADVIRVIIDQAAIENAAPVRHGWPVGVHQALIIITADDGVTEVLRIMTTRLHNDIQMPPGSHGKQFIAKASFLKHVGDNPRFGPEPTFSMPLTTEDLVAAHDRQHHEDFEAYIREIELRRQELEKLEAAIAAGNKPTKE